jgi:hypothetical protein
MDVFYGARIRARWRRMRAGWPASWPGWASRNCRRGASWAGRAPEPVAGGCGPGRRCADQPEGGGVSGHAARGRVCRIPDTEGPGPAAGLFVGAGRGPRRPRAQRGRHRRRCCWRSTAASCWPSAACRPRWPAVTSISSARSGPAMPLRGPPGWASFRPLMSWDSLPRSPGGWPRRRLAVSSGRRNTGR